MERTAFGFESSRAGQKETQHTLILCMPRQDTKLLGRDRASSRDTISRIGYFRERLQHASQEFTSDFTKLLVPLVTLMLQFCGAPIPRDSIPPSITLTQTERAISRL